VFAHRELVLLVQGYDTSQREAPEILRPLVSRLRHKLEVFPALADHIVSIRGTGYVYEGAEVKRVDS
jgi:DNA-binding response OmpR family regulator